MHQLILTASRHNTVQSPALQTRSLLSIMEVLILRLGGMQSKMLMDIHCCQCNPRIQAGSRLECMQRGMGKSKFYFFGLPAIEICMIHLAHLCSASPGPLGLIASFPGNEVLPVYLSKRKKEMPVESNTQLLFTTTCRKLHTSFDYERSLWDMTLSTKR